MKIKPDDTLILEVKGLSATYLSRQGVVRAVDNLSFNLYRGEVLCLVGESGCGKTTAALSILKLLEHLNGKVVGGQVFFKGEDLARSSMERIREIRGNRIAMIFQDAQAALNPVLKVGEQIAESLRLHLGLKESEARDRAVGLMQQLGIPSAESAFHYYPHQFSGGMKQRVMIAIALSCEPEILIADEPTTALDVTTRAQILDILLSLKEKGGLSLLFITHDLATVAGIADRIIVMYGGRMAEIGTVKEIFDSPKHPYTQGLLKCLPRITGSDERLYSIPGNIPSLIDPPDNCLFSPRCPYVMPVCREKRPPEFVISSIQRAACFLNDPEIKKSR